MEKYRCIYPPLFPNRNGATRLLAELQTFFVQQSSSIFFLKSSVCLYILSQHLIWLPSFCV